MKFFFHNKFKVRFFRDITFIQETKSLLTVIYLQVFGGLKSESNICQFRPKRREQAK